KAPRAASARSSAGRCCAACWGRFSAARNVEKRALSAATYRGWGIAFAVLGVLTFSLRPILIKLSYAASPVTPTTLLFLRMVISLPFFLVIGWWLRREEPRLTQIG